jgi:hypothetical protein
MREIGNAIIGVGDEDGAADLSSAGDSKSLLGKFDLKNLLSKKEKPAADQPVQEEA